VTTDGDTLGRIELSRPDSQSGSVIHRGGVEANLRLVDVLPPDEPERSAILAVEPAGIGVCSAGSSR
jgi:hypothetical protein